MTPRTCFLWSTLSNRSTSYEHEAVGCEDLAHRFNTGSQAGTLPGHILNSRFLDPLGVKASGYLTIVGPVVLMLGFFHQSQGSGRPNKDRAHDTTPVINRLRSLLLQILPAPERVFKGTVLVLDLLVRYRGPVGLRSAGRSGAKRWAKNHTWKVPSLSSRLKSRWRLISSLSFRS